MNEVIPIKEEKQTQTPDTGLAPNTKDEQFNRALIPPNVATVGRSVKFRNLFSTSGAVASDTTVVTVTADGSSGNETDMKSFKFFPNEWHVGMCIRISASGVLTADGTRTVTLRVGSGLAPTTVWNSLSTAPFAGTVQWNMVFTGIVASIGPSGTIETHLRGTYNTVVADNGSASAVALDTTSAVIVALTVDWSASTAGNSVSVRQWLVEVLY